MHEFATALRRTFNRALPIVLSLGPIGFLFGIIAARHQWSPLGATLLSILGFSGSGQFVLFSLKDQQVGWWLSLAIILLINLRYVPMSITANRPIKGSLTKRVFTAHYLCDEAFAIERLEEPTIDKIAIRVWICSVWIIGTFLGAVSVKIIPADTAEILSRLSFAANALLTLLALFRARDIASTFPQRGVVVLTAAASFSALLYFLLGPRLFWLPGILASYLFLYFGLKDQLNNEPR